MMKMFKSKKNKGFTLIELLVVIAIIGTLATVIIASLGSAREKSRNTAKISQIKQYMTALELYRSDNGEYPGGTSLSCMGEYSDNRCWGSNGTQRGAGTHPNSSALTNSLIPGYLPRWGADSGTIINGYEGIAYQVANGSMGYSIYYYLEGGLEEDCVIPEATYSPSGGETQCIIVK